MYKEKVYCLVKKFTASMLAAGMVVAGIVGIPEQVDAAVVADEVVYEEDYNIKEYWDATNPEAPVKEGYVFGGWYSAKEENAYLTKEEAAKATTAYAKFVPAQVLSVKAQNKAGTIKPEEGSTSNTHVRIISSLDSKNYDKVGFDIWLANSVQLFKNDVEGEPLETDKIYNGLLVGENKEKKDAVDIFGGVSKYVSVWQLNNIDSAHWSKIIYVRPYWITKDGTKVEGLAKYVHIEDDYMNYISVPVNLLGGETVAAGAMNMTYDNGENAALELIEFEAGRILPKMNHSYTDKTIKMVGNTDTMVGTYKEGETIYANLRFKKPTVNTDFNITYGQFCDWSETIVDVKKAWDTEYVQETASE